MDDELYPILYSISVIVLIYGATIIFNQTKMIIVFDPVLSGLVVLFIAIKIFQLHKEKKL